ncbi:MAG: LysR family transcriptional regulator, partial [Sphingomonadales bacterium]
MNAKIASGVDRARSLEIFAAVIDAGSFSAAGRLLDLTPSAVSRTIDRALLQTLAQWPRLGCWIGRIGCDERFQGAALH